VTRGASNQTRFLLGSLLSATINLFTIAPFNNTHQAVRRHTLISYVVVLFRQVMLVENLAVSQRSISVWFLRLHGRNRLTESLTVQQLVYRYLWALAVILSCHVQLGFFLLLFRTKIVCVFLVSPLCCMSRPPNTCSTVHDTKPIFSLYFFQCKTQPECLGRYNCLATG
jgi:hypothetical protein